MINCTSTKQTLPPAANKIENAENQPYTNNGKNIVEKYWKLLELYGNPIVPAADDAKNAHIIFKTEANQFNGNAGCNIITGDYELKGIDRIRISAKVSTMKMCFDMETETKFLQVLEMADSYAVRNDTLTLHRARMAPLARFVAVYLK
jgi:heat shock protein HslJ